MVFDSYIPKQQRASEIRKIVNDMGFVLIDIDKGYEQYCKCEKLTCQDRTTPHESIPHKDRNTLTFFRTIKNLSIVELIGASQ